MRSGANGSRLATCDAATRPSTIGKSNEAAGRARQVEDRRQVDERQHPRGHREPFGGRGERHGLGGEAAAEDEPWMTKPASAKAAIARAAAGKAPLEPDELQQRAPLA